LNKSKKLKYSPEFKAEVCEYAKKENIVRAEVSFGITRKTISRWLKNYEKGGWEGLSGRKKRKVNSNFKLDENTVKVISEYRLKNPKVPYRSLIEKFELDCSVVLISRKVKKYISGLGEIKSSKEPHTFFIRYRIKRQEKVHDNHKPVFRLELYDNKNDLFFIACSDSINIAAINNFIESVTDNLKKESLPWKFSVIRTNIKYFKSEIKSIIFDRNVKKLFHKLKSGNGYEVPYDISSKVRFICPKPERLQITSYQDHNINFCSMYTPAGDPKFIEPLIACSIDRFGDDFYRSYDYDKALVSYRNLYDISSKCDGNKPFMVKSLYRQCDIYYKYDNYSTACGILNELISLRERCCKKFNEGHIYYYFGKIYSIQNENEKSCKCFSMSVKLFKLSGSEFFKDYLYSEIERKKAQGKIESALESANKLIRTAYASKDKLSACRALDLRGTIYFESKNYDKAIIDFSKQIELAKESDLTGEEIKAISNYLSANILSREANINDIEIMLNRVLFLSEYLKDNLSLIHIYHSLGNFYFYKTDYEPAIKYLTNCAKYYFTKKNFRHYSNAKHYIGLSLFYSGKYNEAADVFYEAMDIEYGDPVIKIHSSNFLGRSLFSLEKYPAAYKYYKISLKLSKNQTNQTRPDSSESWTGKDFSIAKSILQRKEFKMSGIQNHCKNHFR